MEPHLNNVVSSGCGGSYPDSGRAPDSPAAPGVSSAARIPRNHGERMGVGR